MNNETYNNSDNTMTTNNGVPQDTSNIYNNGVTTGNAETLEVVNQEQIEPVYEEVTPQFQEVNIIKKPNRTDSYFDGGLLELIGWRILAGLITVITFTIGRPWAQCMLYAYEYNHTVYNGKRLKFEGKGGDLFVNYFKWIFLTIITFGIYAFFIPVRKQRWLVSNLHFEDEQLIKGESFFDGKTSHLIGLNILCLILNSISLGLLFTFTTCFRLKWLSKHTIINKKRIAFTGGALNLFGKYLLWLFLTLITFGIYGWWLRIKMLKWTTKNTHIRVVGEAEVEDNKALAVAIVVGVVGLLMFILVAPKLIGLVTTGVETSGGHNICLNPFTCKTQNRVGGLNDEYNYGSHNVTIERARPHY